ncbi:MAG: hypothetical protein EBR09_09540 [Proteobacteria bacterium]|nr:hypothetical protein [Pseudomonadota bacterium]
MLVSLKNTVVVLSCLMLWGCRYSLSTGTNDSTGSSAVATSTVVALKGVQGKTLKLTQTSSRSIIGGVKCEFRGDSNQELLAIVPAKQERLVSASGLEYFVQLKNPMSAESCQGEDELGNFDFKSFFVKVEDVELVGSFSVAPAPLRTVPVSLDDLKSARSESLARDMERRRSGGNKSCGLTSFGQRGCWACVGWAMTDTGVFPAGLGADADATPNGFLHATRAARSRKAADGSISINGKRFRSLLAEYRGTPSLAPRGSILFCNTSAAGHAAVITQPANEMRSDVVEILSAPHRQSLCWEHVQEILFPLD